MVKNTLFILLLFFFQNLSAKAVVAGVMKNAYLNDRLEIRVPHYYLDGKSSKDIALTDEKGQFKLTVDVPEPQVVFLIHNEDRLAIFLEPDDSLFISTDLFQFPLAVTFGGRAAQNNRLYRQFLMENPNDFNEFNNLRYKIGYLWTTVEAEMDRTMNDLAPEDFKAFLEKKKVAGFALLDEFTTNNPGAVSANCKEFVAAEILYDWAFHLLFYGNIYKVKHAIEPAFFEFLYDAPTSNEMVGSDAYRRFLMTMMAWRQQTFGKLDEIYVGQYLSSPDYLNEKALAFFRSEIVLLALKAEKYSEILPYYISFLQNNRHPEFDEKVTDSYEKAIRVSPGVAAPDISATDIYGNNFSLKNLRGKVVYLNFWASWCASCIKKMNYFDQFAPELERDGVVIVNVSLDEDLQNWANSISEGNFQGVQLLSKSQNPAGASIAKKYNVEAVPQYFLLSKNGAFADKGYSNQPEDIRKRLLELINQR